MNGFSVRQPGLLTLIQDRGRFGAYNLGLTNGGPLDSLAFDWANRLLGNDSNASALEISFGGLSLEAGVDTSFVITGQSVRVISSNSVTSPMARVPICRSPADSISHPVLEVLQP